MALELEVLVVQSPGDQGGKEESASHSPKELEAAVDEDIQRFDKFFQSLPNPPLTRPEYAILKSYLYWKTHNSPCPAD